MGNQSRSPLTLISDKLLISHCGGLNPSAVSRRIPNREAHPLFSICVKWNLEVLGPKWHRVGQVNDLAVDFLAIAPYQFGKFERKGILDRCTISGFRSPAFDTPIVEENFSGRAKEVTGTYALHNRRPAFVI